MNILVTGTTTGIGKAISERLSKEGHVVFGTSRNPDGFKYKTTFECIQLDITSQKSIDDCVSSFASKNISIDVLINNAGIGVCGAIEETSDQLAREQIETNFWGAVNITKAFLPQMRNRKQGKILFITSLAGLIGVPYQGFYAASKHALEGFCKSLRYEINEFNISVSVIEPGFFKTNLHSSFKYAEAIIKDYSNTREKALKEFENSIEHAPSPIKVADTVVRVINSKSPKYSYRVGKDARFLPLLQFFSYRLFEIGTRKKFNL